MIIHIFTLEDRRWIKLAGTKLVVKDNEFKRNDINTIDLFPFENIDSSYKGKLGLTYVICPMGKFHPYDPINKVDIIPTEFEQGGNGNWYLHCFTHKFGFFYVAYFNNGQRNFYGLQDGKTEWGRQYTRSAWFADKLNEDYNFGNDDYPYIYIGG